jgi:hypothetical protein
MPATADRPASIAAELERTRLQHRAGRLEAVVRELRKRTLHHPAPHLLGRAIDGFDAELRAVRKRLSARS